MRVGDNRAVFLSYASQDADAALRICEALRAAGVEVWFDQNELVGGDAWDAKIRKQIQECELFVPIISANTEARLEGYFRLEWKLAAQRSHTMADERAYLLPVVIDDTRDASAKVPSEFKSVQWVRLRPSGFGAPGAQDEAALATYCKHVGRLVRGEAAAPSAEEGRAVARVSDRRKTVAETDFAGRRPALLRAAWVLAGVASVGLVAWLALKHRDPGSTSTAPAVSSGSAEVRELVARISAQLDSLDVSRAGYELAEEWGRRAVALGANDSEAWAAASQVDTWMIYHGYDASTDRRTAARGKVARALQLTPKSYSVRLAQACNLVRGVGSNNVPALAVQAEEILRVLLRERPSEPRACFALGILCRNLGREEETRAAFAQMARTPEFAAAAWSELGWAEYIFRRHEAAEKAADRSIAVQPYTFNLSLKSQMLMWWRGDVAAAKLTLARLPASALQDDFSLSQYCHLHLNARDPEAVLRALTSAPREWLHSNYYEGPTAYLAGKAHALAGRKTAAEIEWRAALQLVERRLEAAPNAADLVRFKSRLLLLLGRKEESMRNGQIAAELSPAPIIGMRVWSELLEDTLLHGRTEQAFALLEEQVGRRMVTWGGLKLNPALDPLRSDPRFQALVTRVAADPELAPAEAHQAGAAQNSASRAPREASTLAPAKSVAVLAFANLSDDKDNEYFSDGISEELLNVLAKVPGLKVSARTSAFYFKGKPTQIADIATQLGVAYVVEGSVRKSGNRVRITAQLIKASDGFHVWSDNFDRELKDIFAVQDEIAGLIAKQLSLKLEASAVAAKAVSPPAIELYLQGRQAWSLRTMEGLVRAEDLLTRALALEPNFARAHTALADVWLIRDLQESRIGYFGQRASIELARSVAKIEHALVLDANTAEAYASLGFGRMMGWQLADAERELRRAVALNPNNAIAHHWLGDALVNDGYMDDALAELRLATSVDPLSHRSAERYARALLDAGRGEEALSMIDHALQLQGGADLSLGIKAEALWRLRRIDEAVATARRVRFRSAIGPTGAVVLAYAGLNAEAEAALAALPAGDPSRFLVLMGLGRREEALTVLEDRGVPMLLLSVLFYSAEHDAIRSDPRFTKFLADTGMAKAHARAQVWRAANQTAGKHGSPSVRTGKEGNAK